MQNRLKKGHKEVIAAIYRRKSTGQDDTDKR
jgi:hypothetical protein